MVPANLNAPGQIIISGEKEAVTVALTTAIELGIRRAVPLM